MFALLVFIVLGVSLTRADSTGSTVSADPALPPISTSNPEQNAEVGDASGITPASTGEVLIDEEQNDALTTKESDEHPNLPTSTNRCCMALPFQTLWLPSSTIQQRRGPCFHQM